MQGLDAMNAYFAFFLLFYSLLNGTQAAESVSSIPNEETISQPAPPSCDIKSAMSDAEMQICHIRIQQPICQWRTPTDTVSKIQAVLQLRGYYLGDLTGTLDEHTQSAILVYKEDYQLPMKDLIDPPLLASLHFETLLANKTFRFCTRNAVIKQRKSRHKRRKH